MEQTQTLPNFVVTRDGEVDEKLSRVYKTGPFTEVKKRTSLQLAMLRYDILHGTRYRRVYNRLHREARNRAFEASIGLTRVAR